MAYQNCRSLTFLRRLENIHKIRLRCISKGTPAKKLLFILKDIEVLLKSGCVNKKLFSINFFRFIVDLLDRRLLTNPKLARCLQRTLSATYYMHPEYRWTLQQLGLGEALVKILKREISREGINVAVDGSGGDESAVACHLMASLFPRLGYVPYIHDVKSINSHSILYDSYSNKDFEIGKEVSAMLRVIFPAVLDVCRSRRNCLSYDLLLLKLLHWVNRLNLVEHLAGRKEIVDYVKSLLSSDERDKVKIGKAVVSQVASKYPELLESGAISDHRLAKRFMKKVRRTHVSRANRSTLIRSMLEFIMFSENHAFYNYNLYGAKKLHLVDWLMTKRQSRLETFVAAFLGMPGDVRRVKGKLIISPEGVRAFEHLVKFVKQAIEDAQVDNERLREIRTEMYLPKKPKSPAEVNLGFVRSSAFSKVLGFSRSPGKLKFDPNFRAMRLASILQAVNENWKDLFWDLPSNSLIDRKCFESSIVDKKFLKNFPGIKRSIEEVNRYITFISDYAFLMSFKARQEVFHLLKNYFIHTQNSPYVEITYNVDRSKLLDSFTRLLESEPVLNSFNTNIYWQFTFQGERGIGPGPTKEFYSEFSHDIQRHDLDLWLGDPEDANSNGIQYVRSESGLFLTPVVSTKSKQILKTIGKVMAKSLLYGNIMDLDFSVVFYKCLFPNALGTRRFSLDDVIDVMPSLSRLLESLLDALRKKREIEEYGDSLTEEERTEALANITCNGCSFRDLELNFTFPGHPDVEMKEGGSEVCLNIHNVEEYLKLLAWWLFHKAKTGFTYLRKELKKYGALRDMKLFYPDEMEFILCGTRSEQWSVKYLADNCVVQCFSLKSPVPGYLFEVLASLTESERGQFLKFVTGKKRLPIGGLKALKPRLTVYRRGTTGDPDFYLPSSNTYTNLLFLTKYTSRDRLREKLLLAIREGTNSFQYF